MRGEYAPPGLAGKMNTELPPRARRIHLGTLILLPHRRTTSACAENTRGWWGRYQPPGNYLRVRGEYQLLPVTLKLFAELPPRARRILHIHNALGSTRGTTSACAENTPDPNASYLILGNYLRVRGEYIRVYPCRFSQEELPPRARRIQLVGGERRNGRGTTSACAENTKKPTSDFEWKWNYLRVRGEYMRTAWCRKTLSELPPRARRIQIIERIGVFIIGTTSACAENTGRVINVVLDAGNYLRVRGEY